MWLSCWALVLLSNMNVRNWIVSKTYCETMLWIVDFADNCCISWANLMWCWFDSNCFRPQHWIRSNKLHEMQCFYSQTGNERMNITSTLVFCATNNNNSIHWNLRRLTCEKIVFVKKFIFLFFWFLVYFQLWPDAISRYSQFQSKHSPNDVKIWHFISRTDILLTDDGNVKRWFWFNGYLCSIEWWTNYLIKF